MNENDVMSLISTQVQALSDFDSTNVAIAKWGVLNTGKSDHYAIIKPGETERPPLTFGVKDNQAQTIIEVWQRYKDDGTSLTSLLAYVDSIVARLDVYWTLGDTSGTLRNADVIRKGAVTEQWNKDGGVAWLKRDVFVQWNEEEEF